MSRYGMACSVVIWVEYCMVSHSMVWLFAWNMVWYGMVWYMMWYQQHGIRYAMVIRVEYDMIQV